MPGSSEPRSSRQRQFPSVVPGRFIRASLPRPSTSCAGTIASAARRAYAISISPSRLARIEAGDVPLSRRQRGEPAGGRVGVVGAGVDDLVATVVLGPVRVARGGREAQRSTTIPGSPSSSRSR